MSNDKAILRARVCEMRTHLSAEEKSRSDYRVIRNLTLLKQFEAAEVIFCFVGTENEIDTIPLIQEALAKKKRVCTPRCLGKGVMEAREIRRIGDLYKGKYGIMEPDACAPLVSPDEIELAVIPCVTCDVYGNRIGYGGGYYDRYLKDCKFLTALLCREVFLSEFIPFEKKDIRIDIVITDERVYNL